MELPLLEAVHDLLRSLRAHGVDAEGMEIVLPAATYRRFEHELGRQWHEAMLPLPAPLASPVAANRIDICGVVIRPRGNVR